MRPHSTARLLFCLTMGSALSTPGCGSSVPSCRPTAFASGAPAPEIVGPRNVILLLADGTGPEAWTLARWVKGSSLNVDRILTGAIRTYGADSIITDSAPGASAYATGKKGSDKAIAVGAWNTTIDRVDVHPQLAYVPLVTLLEAAKVAGFATGLIATSNIQHATPAAFSAHVADRNQYEEIAEQQVYQGMDLVLSGGAKYLLPKSVLGGTRLDGQDLVSVIKRRGYRYVSTRTELLAKEVGRVWGAFAANDLAYELDRPRFAPTQPSLAEMTAYAITNLSSSDRGKRQGLFLFVEGSKVDWSAHANDPVGVATELLAFDAAVGGALGFAESNKNTQVIVVTDHGTGGLTIGAASAANYSRTDDDSVVIPLRRAKVTAERLAGLLGADDAKERVIEVVRNEWGIVDLSETELLALMDATTQKADTQSVLARLVSLRSQIGWTTHGHTGADVPLYAYGPAHPIGLVENTVIGQGIAKYLQLDLETWQRRLYVDVDAVLTPRGYRVQLDRSDPYNGQLVIEKSGQRARLPWAQNLLIVGPSSHELEGIVVYSDKLNRVFVPQQAIDWLMRELP